MSRQSTRAAGDPRKVVRMLSQALTLISLRTATSFVLKRAEPKNLGSMPCRTALHSSLYSGISHAALQ